ncbi:hypothetical protein KP509_10G070500 [Ceratopteris richardii]|uniref:Adenosine deaminase domain-containing protein n=1 Tax=Ceratopteris richardii TaxID=49495 RepID=A0A8T2TWB2_CERRI|nr:hypothetical protein KP509_10G070500 [Ceratopteris richardii]
MAAAREATAALFDGDDGLKTSATHAIPFSDEVRSWMPWCRSIPKVELHAHLNGSIRSSTLLELASRFSKMGTINFHEVQAIILKGDRSLTECFKLFELIHLLTTDHQVITQITKEVVEDFASENVIYLELRTTPKWNASVGMTKKSYVEAVFAGLKAVETVQVISNSLDVKQNGLEMERSKRIIHVRLLLSIDRRENTEAAIETVQLALDMQKFGVVGIDLSGNPRVGDWKTFLPALKLAREKGLPITLHCGEVPNQSEIQNMLSFQPERIGHACCLEESEWAQLLQSSIPVEVCLTSNVRTETVPFLPDHHFASLYNSRHPLIVCTDDPGIFGTDISQEYALAAVCFGLTKENLQFLARNALKHIFANDDVKEELENIFDLSVNITDSILQELK